MSLVTAARAPEMEWGDGIDKHRLYTYAYARGAVARENDRAALDPGCKALTIYISEKGDTMALHVLGAGVVVFALGVVSTPLVKAAAPLIGRALRPAIRTVVKEGILLQRQVQAVVQEVREGVDQVSTEARTELDSQERGGAEAS
jgi:hypothetical protein